MRPGARMTSRRSRSVPITSSSRSIRCWTTRSGRPDVPAIAGTPTIQRKNWIRCSSESATSTGVAASGADGAAMAISAPALAHGLLDESLFAYVEDVALSLHLRSKGFAVVFVPDAVVRHKGSAFERLPEPSMIANAQSAMVRKPKVRML